MYRSYGDRIFVDFNQPLSYSEIKLTVFINDVRKKYNERGGECVDWMNTITDGPGMQARWKEKPTDFFTVDSFVRPDNSNDKIFYSIPRLVTHVDNCAISIIKGLYGMHLRDGMKVLDLMSRRSHIP